jgi:FkbM family methyltransferase
MNVFLIKLRSLGRKMGLHKAVSSIRSKPNSYEEHFHKALETTIRPGDVVWDVGANVGLYSEMFCRWVGPKGHVVAFEPNPEPFAQIKQQIPDCSWLTLENVALGARAEVCNFIVTEGYSRNGHIDYGAQAATPGVFRVPIRVDTGDSVCEQIGHAPNVVKIDVEGFEEDVLLGMDRLLLSPALRSVLLEVHFQALESRGQAVAPVRIEKFLKGKGFRIKWVDKNHLQADRALAA